MIKGTTRVAFVLGWPIEHSCSPPMLNAAFSADQIDAVMVPIGVPPEKLRTVIRGLQAIQPFGASVTLPHKRAITELCDELSASARAAGAVNCLEFNGARLVGHNTDGEGFSDALHAAGFDPGGKHVVLLGAGGAARAVACGAQGARVEVIARRPQEVSWANMRAWTTDNLLECFAGADLVVDCTPTGLDSVTDAEFTNALPLDNLKSGAWVATLVYHRRTRLLERASSLGHATLDGRAMLVHQGARAFTIWTGSAAPIEVMARALDASLAR